MKQILTNILNPKLNLDRVHLTLLIYRILISLSMIFIHGWKKIIDFENEVLHIPDPFGVGGFTSTVMAIFGNIVAPAFIILGLFTRVMTIPIIIITLTGVLIVHFNDPWAVKDVPYMYTIAFSLILILGPGKYSLDNKFFNHD